MENRRKQAMNFDNTFLTICTVASFFLSFAGFYVLNQQRISRLERQIPPFAVIFVFFAVFGLIAAFVFRQDNDFISGYSVLELPVLLAATALIFYVSSRFSAKYAALTVLSGTAVLTFLMPESQPLLPQIPAPLSLLLSVLLWFAFSFLYRFLNGVESVAGLHTVAVALGIFTLSLAAALPHLLGALALILAAVTGAFLLFNWYPARLQLSDAGCTALGFLLGGLIFRSASEGAAPCLIIFNMFFIIEVSWALLQALALRDKYSDITANTAYFQANISGLSPDNIANNILRLEIVMIVLGYFEAYSPNIYSIPVLSAVITAWYLSKLKHWQTANQSFREINRNVINEIKSNFEDIKDNINKDKRN